MIELNPAIKKDEIIINDNISGLRILESIFESFNIIIINY
jgi:hypothetical protein